ncbi:hypothetical protein [Nitratireductor rhodophyticola]|uniref:hypothetical protein n=1 Tax=Nitratireductor rhodophyticola TaxID=2854036 RepID=UPI003BADB95F
MTPYASVALIKRNGNVVFRRPRKETQTIPTQVRKAAMRYWRSAMAETDTLIRVALVREVGGRVEICERQDKQDRDRAWVRYEKTLHDAAKEAHIAACLAELGVKAEDAPPAVPDVLTINGFVYRREI